MRGSSRGRRRLMRERGQALVEFILLLPVFLAITFGLIEFGKGFNYWIDLTHLANEGSRYASVQWFPGCGKADGSSCTPTNLKLYLQGQGATDELRNGGTAYIEDPMQVDICYPPPGTGLTSGQVGTPIRVTVTTHYKLPVLDGALGLAGLDDLGELEMSSSSTMRLERTVSNSRMGGAPPAC